MTRDAPMYSANSSRTFDCCPSGLIPSLQPIVNRQFDQADLRRKKIFLQMVQSSLILNFQQFAPVRMTQNMPAELIPVHLVGPAGRPSHQHGNITSRVNELRHLSKCLAGRFRRLRQHQL